ncbi:uncharacterized protein CELE_Y71H2AL.4 [Caenorhabditis elegans]|uniref:Uncharacterized protein n=1 Tax=Caenorhabditis elegans TaxID=6239 RepID=A0A2K5ATV9_CAEEL|nr:Uncharacterized protein CELE_Y71H2AL.4 [Caenorhabditis elegans]SPC47552.1 Uncharacterized protein CELE_Y71H2AL.4 [Caenorhabditis elegans]|eukprot:NP_001348756.1 Uncharacterized protein CELE_Y71H2AL.4 [Caenorhabditis elegans]
MLKCSSSCSGI